MGFAAIYLMQSHVAQVALWRARGWSRARVWALSSTEFTLLAAVATPFAVVASAVISSVAAGASATPATDHLATPRGRRGSSDRRGDRLPRCPDRRRRRAQCSRAVCAAADPCCHARAQRTTSGARHRRRGHRCRHSLVCPRRRCGNRRGAEQRPRLRAVGHRRRADGVRVTATCGNS